MRNSSFPFNHFFSGYKATDGERDVVAKFCVLVTVLLRFLKKKDMKWTCLVSCVGIHAVPTVLCDMLPVISLVRFYYDRSV